VQPEDLKFEDIDDDFDLDALMRPDRED
jgi:hypothetical protein